MPRDLIEKSLKRKLSLFAIIHNNSRMPELPEVETIAKELNQALEGKRIVKFDVLREVSFKGNERELLGKIIKNVDRRAKMILIEFKNWDKTLVIHLKMTGQLVWRLKDWSEQKLQDEVVGGHPTVDWIEKLPSKHTRVVIRFDDESYLFFNDLRVFGWMRVFDAMDLNLLFNKLPPDVIDKKFSLEYFGKILSRSRRAIKLILMDQAKIGGVGNIYANDALFKAGIDPRRASNSLTVDEAERLRGAIRQVIALGIKHGGATYSDFVAATGLGGKYQEYFLVYGREGERCKNCKEKIKKVMIGGRGSYYCNKCQK